MLRLCAPDDLQEGFSRGFRLPSADAASEHSLLAVRRHGVAYVYLNRCPHRGITLEWQPDRFLDDSSSLIQCATHGALFLIESGECVAGPCAGQALQAVRCHEDTQAIWVEL